MSGLTRQVLTGAPHERGVRHGESYAAEIDHNVGTYLDVFETRGVDTDRVRERAAAFIPRLEADNADYAEEMAGVAAGSDRPIEEIALINLRYEVMYDAYTDGSERPAATDEMVDGCTSCGVEPKASADGHTYIGQNWDWLPAVETFVMDVRRDDGPNFLAVTEAGMVGGKFGLNECGIGYVVNGLATPRDGENPSRKPTHVRGREILDAERLDTAIEPVIATDRPGSRNYLIGHANGELLDLETAPEVVNYRYPENGLLTHTNHFEDRTRVESRLERRSPHSLVRGMRVRRLLEREVGSIDPDTLKRTLRDDFCHPTGICRYVTESEDAQADFHTKVSVIMDLNEGRMALTDGPPRDATYETYQVA
ncbi:C45 family autoproteolytic acyltransferase/hydrolase [Halomarina halobia]|uniref:C45 family autoproteolytic acyltransferase/hydrolase n=1 Tax=Halomarina halobia TaxID=3033386 RepID=A0ABD6AFM6_9EURY|nr:C45 family peptidase [Halomarina sp. PSR21]